VSEDVTAKLSRWSQRKLAARHGGELPEPADGAVKKTDSDGKDNATQVPAAEKTAGVTPTAEEIPVLPPIDELTAQSDYTVFLAKNVPEALKRAALRKLWLSDPVFANLDGLNDYDEDYNMIDKVITAAQTGYRPGKGYLEEIEEKLENESIASGDKAVPAADARAKTQADSGAPDGEPHGSATENRKAPSEQSADALRRLAAAEPDAKADALSKDTGEK
jgi:Protein of unknown function (DUF3306)